MVVRPLAVAAAATDIIVVATLGAITPGHDVVHGYISTLGQRGAPYVTWYVAGGTLAAGLHLAFFGAIWPHLRRDRFGVAGIGLLVGFMLVHWLAAAFFPCDPQCDRITATGNIHYALGFAAFVSSGVGTILFSVAAWRLRMPAHIHIATGFVVVGSLLLLAADLSGSYRGIAERGTVAALALWTVVVGFSVQQAPSNRSPSTG